MTGDEAKQLPQEGEAPGPIALRWWPAAAAPPIVLGTLWLWLGWRAGVPGVLLDAMPGMLLLATGLSNLLWAGDSRIFQFMSFGAVSGVLLSFPSTFVLGLPEAALLLAGSVLSFVASGYLAVGQEPLPPGVPAPKMGTGLAARAAEDEFSMCSIVLTTWPLAVGNRATRIRRELDEALTLFRERGWLEHPAGYHPEPPPIENLKDGGLSHPEPGFEHITFESLYEPWPEEPGRERWLSYERNRTAHAWVLRHPGEPRPWLVCIHGIRMGSPKADFRLFRPAYLHHKLGLNLLLPILPIHGPRRIGPVSGDRILSGDVMDMLHAGAQAVWDIRRLVARLREQEGAPAVGLLGHSLGGYAAALLSGLDGRADCVVVGNPAVDPSRLFWQNALSLATRYLKAEGVREEAMAELLRVVSPLAFRPKVAGEGRTIIAGVADRVAPAIEAYTLWHHWEKPRIAWYSGTHTSFLRAPEARAAFVETLRSSKVLQNQP